MTEKKYENMCANPSCERHGCSAVYQLLEAVASGQDVRAYVACSDLRVLLEQGAKKGIKSCKAIGETWEMYRTLKGMDLRCTDEQIITELDRFLEEHMPSDRMRERTEISVDRIPFRE